ncbi:MAG: hypothetical protein PHI37_01970 [Candidatus Gracilibacteria bacterium]|nr:hypothetical protein [Candidatus Gracilibacteria bacterium]
MSIENNGFQNEKIKKTLSPEEMELEEKRQIEFKKQKERISVEIESEHNLLYLKEMINNGFVSQETAKKIIDGIQISTEEVKDIFNKINQIEEVKDIDNYLPREYRITQEQYFKAISDDIFRVQVLTKLDFALTLLSKQIVPDTAIGLNIFSGFLGVLDKNLILIQENTIDIKNGLKKVDKQKLPKQDIKLSFWQKIIKFIKELLY